MAVLPMQQAVAASTGPSLLVLSPASASLNGGGSVTLVASFQNTSPTAVRWFVDGIANGDSAVGTISVSGVSATYTAPAKSGTHKLRCTSTASSTLSATASVVVTAVPVVTSVVLSPASASLNGGGSVSLVASFQNTSPTAVRWFVDGIANGDSTVGSIAVSGLSATYTAPAKSGTHSIRCSSTTSSILCATASVAVTAVPVVTSVALSPAALTLVAGAQNQFHSTVQGTGSYNAAVTWAARLGTITSAGLYTAPAAGGTDLVSATSVAAPSLGASIPVTVTAAGTITAVAVSPASLTLNVASSTTFTAAVSGTGSFSQAVTWSAQRGSITSSGLYTPPAAGGVDVVTAASVQTPGITGTATVTVDTAQGVPTAPVITGPTELQAGSGPYTASITLGTGLSATWTLTGGTLLTGANTATVTFEAGSAGTVTLACTVTNGNSSASTSRWMVALPFAPRNYLADLKAAMASSAASITADLATGDAGTYYSDSYYLMGMAAGADASGDTGVMDTLMGYISQIMATAQPLVYNGVTYQEWGPFAGGKPGQLNTFQATGPLARAVAVCAAHPVFQARYAAQIPLIEAFVDQSVFEFWFNKQNGVYADPSSAYLAGDIPWLPANLGGWGTSCYPEDVDTCDHLGMMATWMYQATGKPIYLEIATRVAEGFRTHLTTINCGYQWDHGIMPIGTSDGNQDGSPDTSHSNREAMMVSAMYEAGIQYTAADIQLFTNTFTGTIWNQSLTSPMFTNYIDGGNALYRAATAWQNGIVYHGWDMLGRFSPLAHQVLAASYDTIMTQGSLNQSLLCNASSYGQIELAGALLRDNAR